MTSSNRAQFALSVKQPWATLILHGLKPIEIRSWPTIRRGRIHIHTGKIADARPEGWRHLPGHLQAFANQRGGLLGSVEITGCIAYAERAHFAADRRLHRNDPSWFRKRLFGFLLSHPEPEPYRALAGNIKFFPVPRRMR